MSARGPDSHPDGPQHRKLLLAVRAGDLAGVKAALATGAHPDAVAIVKKQSALEIAMGHGDGAIAEALLHAGARVWGNQAINEGLQHTDAHWGPYLQAFKDEAAYALWPVLWKHRGKADSVEALFAAAFAASRQGRDEAFLTLLHHCQAHSALAEGISSSRWMSCALVSGKPAYAEEVERVRGKLTPFEMSKALLHDHGLASQPDKKVMPCIRYAMARIGQDALALRQTLLGTDSNQVSNSVVAWWIGKAHKERVALVGGLLKKHPSLVRTLKKHTFELLCRAGRRGSPALMQEVMSWVEVKDLEPWAEGLGQQGEPTSLWGQMLTNLGPVATRMGHFALANGLAPLVNEPTDVKGRTVLHRAGNLQVSKRGTLEKFLDDLVAHGARLDLQDRDGQTAEAALLSKGFASWVARQREQALQKNLETKSQDLPSPRISPRF